MKVYKVGLDWAGHSIDGGEVQVFIIESRKADPTCSISIHTSVYLFIPEFLVKPAAINIRKHNRVCKVRDLTGYRVRIESFVFYDRRVIGKVLL